MIIPVMLAVAFAAPVAPAACAPNAPGCQAAPRQPPSVMTRDMMMEMTMDEHWKQRSQSQQQQRESQRSRWLERGRPATSEDAAPAPEGKRPR